MKIWLKLGLATSALLIACSSNLRQESTHKLTLTADLMHPYIKDKMAELRRPESDNQFDFKVLTDNNSLSRMGRNGNQSEDETATLMHPYRGRDG